MKLNQHKMGILKQAKTWTPAMKMFRGVLCFIINNIKDTNR
jgi:hypothetical protein